jgi:penicillin-insensitive murein endopeptidase
MLTGCAELGVITDGTSVSMGRPSDGYLSNGVRLPDSGEGFVTREVWKTRNNRYGTDELLDLITAVGRRMATRVTDVKLVVADLSGQGGGASHLWHRSHQSGRDVDLLYYMRDASGNPFEADAMHLFDARGRARDGTGITVDVARTWLLVKELLTAPEAPVQWVFMYQPLANLVIEHATKIGEPEVLIARARKAVRQPGDSAPHNDHIHVRVYCSTADKLYGCRDIGPMELLAEREAERARDGELAAIVATLVNGAAQGASQAPAIAATAPELTMQLGGAVSSVLGATGSSSSSSSSNLNALGQLLRTRTDRVYLRRWR